MKIKTAYMGEIEINPKEMIWFEHGIPGFEEEKNFVSLPIEENSVFQILQSTRTEGLAFIITSPYALTENYNFELDEATLHSLNIQNENEVAVFAIVSLKDTLSDSTVNLKAPIVLNTNNRKAKQVILDNEDYAIRHKISFESVKG
ncbi:flagellar assembly protein FliW [Ureibacillus manganicus]|uniref:Flagellar assembly factor FliW n=1 Tax=Ureibacillus manganicus DSM 26584 TaxID=1384049 RepID=A0A0A3I7B0_9BACL|nr:flagellar assembly protein FliW [Ureibacillus manganicus]KGR80614.1 flagellar assembly protein FliW [Ureibacillus manganicus DSM 26584]